MGLYFVYVKDLSNRFNDHIFCFKQNKCYLYSKEDEYSELFNVDKDILDTYKKIVLYASNNGLDAYEICLDNQTPIKELLNCLYSYLLDKDISIGLLSNSGDFVNQNEALMNEYGVTIIDHEALELKRRYLIQQKQKYYAREASPRPNVLVHASKAGMKYKMARSAPRRVDTKPSIVLEESFHDKLMKFIIESNKDNPEIYKKAGISKQVFSKIISDKDMIPTKLTVIALCIGLELTLRDANELMNAAGYSLSHSIVLDVIIIRYLRREIYDLDLINQELYEHGCPLLGWKPRDDK